jgi:hypothetical protein
MSMTTIKITIIQGDKAAACGDKGAVTIQLVAQQCP